MSWEDQIATSDAQGSRSPWIQQGVYVADIYALKQIKDRKEKTRVFVDLLIQESTNPEFPKGMVVTDGYNITDHDPAPGAVNALLLTLTSKEKLTPAEVKEAFSDENPLRGFRVKVRAFNKKTKSGGDFVRTEYERVATARQVAENPRIGLGE